MSPLPSTDSPLPAAIQLRPESLYRAIYLLPAAARPPPSLQHTQIPTVRMWLVRIAVSLAIGAFLGGAAAYLALPRAVTGSGSPCTAAGSGAGAADTTSPWWDTVRGAGAGEPGEGAEQSFGDRLNKALFAARAGEAAAQQVLLVRIGFALRWDSCVLRVFFGGGRTGLVALMMCAGRIESGCSPKCCGRFVDVFGGMSVEHGFLVGV